MSTSGTDLQSIARAVSARRGFTLGASIGGGSFKQSYRVKDPAGTELALKLVMSGSVGRLKREIEAVSRCNHPNIGRLLEVQFENTPHNQVVYFLEPYLGGGTLADRLRSSGKRSPSEIRTFAKQLSSALQYLSELELVHRDIKPENILFGKDPNVPILVDFGLVRDLAAESLTASHMARGPGTPLYSPPEQLNNQKELIDWRSDQFALGATLCVAAFDFHPYAEAGDTPIDTVDRVARRAAPSARFTDAARAAGLEPLVRMVRAFPVMRYCFPDELIGAWN